MENAGDGSARRLPRRRFLESVCRATHPFLAFTKYGVEDAGAFVMVDIRIEIVHTDSVDS